MAKEIERRFIVIPENWDAPKEGMRIKQGYLSTDPERTVRVRIKGPSAFLTIKGRRTGPSALEFEYPIPVSDADQILDRLCGNRVLEKTRYRIPAGVHVWEVDVFHGSNDGLVLAEIEMQEEGDEFETPAWIGKEVTTDYRYTNARLSDRPFSEWQPGK